MNFLIKLFGGYTPQEYNEMFFLLSKRVMEAREETNRAEDDAKESINLAMDIAGRYNDRESIEKILVLGKEANA